MAEEPGPAVFSKVISVQVRRSDKNLPRRRKKRIRLLQNAQNTQEVQDETVRHLLDLKSKKKEILTNRQPVMRNL